MPICFLGRDRKGVELDRRGGGEELEEIEGGEAVVRIYHIKICIFNKRKKLEEPHAVLFQNK